jgi:tetratricopeptide (TPR) repeat protein
MSLLSSRCSLSLKPRKCKKKGGSTKLSHCGNLVVRGKPQEPLVSGKSASKGLEYAEGGGWQAPARVFLMENHDAAYPIWQSNGIRNRTLVHVDAHHDMWRTGKHETITVANFISAAIEDGITKEIFWVVPDATWTSLDGIFAVNQHLRELARQYSSRRRPSLTAHGRIFVPLSNVDLTICSLNSVPQITKPVLLDIDLDFLLIERVHYGASDSHCALPWCWPDELLQRMSARGIESDFVTISYSVEGEYTPVRWRHLGDEVALRLQPSPDRDQLDAMGCIRKGAVAAHHGLHDEAEQAYRKAMGLWPQSFGPPFHLALLYANVGRLDQAREMYRRAVSMDADGVLKMSHGLGSYWSGRYADAERQFCLMKGLDPHNPYPWLGLALIESKRANWERALELLQEASLLAPASIDIQRGLAKVLTRLKRNKDAIAAYEYSLKLALKGHRPLDTPPITNVPDNALADRDHWKTFARLARLYEQERDGPRAIQACRASLAGGTDAGAIRWRLARLYYSRRRWREGLRETFNALRATARFLAGGAARIVADAEVAAKSVFYMALWKLN